jgi:hypothetical protein
MTSGLLLTGFESTLAHVISGRHAVGVKLKVVRQPFEK